ncbi:GNAT family N-acetyltransferase [Listeria rustica]|uniref:GNAT family N-acetyltransferase n=1 Tax=Listeria rustica TaxID=2713503 RepID=A0A7W1T4F4_9LIST|nr:GNAT family N-acetyltransferase [Listeria rustica]MBA3925254.1 GNAT family N-acetyltransferase [Listeria rustica]
MKIDRLDSLSLVEQVALWNEAFADYLVPAAMTEASFTARMEKLQQSPHESLIAKVDGEAAAIILTGTRDFTNTRMAWIGGLAVVPRFRKMGISNQLLERLFVSYQEQGVDESRLEVISENIPALRLYQKLGYTQINELIYLTGTLQDHGVASYRLKEVNDPNDYIALEEDVLPWQNRIAAHHKIATIWRNDEQLGYIVYGISDENLILLQVRLNNAPNQILGLLQAFHDMYGSISCAVFNEVVTSEYLPVLLDRGFEKVAKQIQMRKKI